MATPDEDLFTLLGVDPSVFPEDLFRAGVGFAMEMGKHPNEDRQLYFFKKGTGGPTYWQGGSQLGSTPQIDRDGNPLDPTIEVRRPDDTTVRVDYAVEVTEQQASDLGVGTFRPTRISVTVLDDAYAQVKDCREAMYNGDRFVYAYEPEAEGLFEVAVHTLVYTAKDET